MTDLYIFGDSIVYGQWDEQGGWSQRLRATIDGDFISGRGPKRLAYILGVPGDTAADLLARMDAEMAGRFNPANSCAIVLAVGINDAHFSTSAQKDRFTQDEFERNLGRLVGIARKYTKHVLLTGLNPIDESKVQPLPWNSEKSYSTARLQAFNAIIEKLAREEGLLFADIWRDWAASDHLPYLCDGLHPNSAGHARIAAFMAPLVDRLLTAAAA